MSSRAQLKANRANAKHSTGPKTEAGKQESSQNAIKHGFYSKSFLIRDDEREDFEDLRDNLGMTYCPKDGLAYDLFCQLLHAAWNLHRLRRMESEIYLKSDNPFRDPATLAELDTLAGSRPLQPQAGQEQFPDAGTSPVAHRVHPAVPVVPRIRP